MPKIPLISPHTLPKVPSQTTYFPLLFALFTQKQMSKCGQTGQRQRRSLPNTAATRRNLTKSVITITLIREIVSQCLNN